MQILLSTSAGARLPDLRSLTYLSGMVRFTLQLLNNLVDNAFTAAAVVAFFAASFMFVGAENFTRVIFRPPSDSAVLDVMEQFEGPDTMVDKRLK